MKKLTAVKLCPNNKKKISHFGPNSATLELRCNFTAGSIHALCERLGNP